MPGHQKNLYTKNSTCWVSGFIVPKEFIVNVSLRDLERMLGFRSQRFEKGAAFAQLDTVPGSAQLEYFGDTRTAAHRFEENRNKDISKPDLNNAAYQYLRSTTKLIKVLPLKSHDSSLTDDDNWPSGFGAMQYKLKSGIWKHAMVIDVVEDYPNGSLNH